MNSISSIILWCASLEALAWGASPLLSRALPSFPDRGTGLAKTTGILLFGTAVWLLNVTGVIETSPDIVRVLAALIVLGGALSWLAAPRPPLPERRIWVADRLLWYSVFFVFLALRAYQPAIFWGEKPMDFTFLNYFTRLERLPPEDPWAAGHPMSYYYLGTYFCALLNKLTGIPPAIGYNLAIATLPALLVSGLCSLLLSLTRNRLLSISGALAISLFGNIEVLRLLISGKMPIGFDLSWASTRLYTSPAFNEYPLWSFSFADLHAHVITYPIPA